MNWVPLQFFTTCQKLGDWSGRTKLPNKWYSCAFGVIQDPSQMQIQMLINNWNTVPWLIDWLIISQYFYSWYLLFHILWGSRIKSEEGTSEYQLLWHVTSCHWAITSWRFGRASWLIFKSRKVFLKLSTPWRWDNCWISKLRKPNTTWRRVSSQKNWHKPAPPPELRRSHKG
jgi:hypothetical protein